MAVVCKGSGKCGTSTTTTPNHCFLGSTWVFGHGFSARWPEKQTSPAPSPAHKGRDVRRPSYPPCSSSGGEIVGCQTSSAPPDVSSTLPKGYGICKPPHAYGLHASPQKCNACDVILAPGIEQSARVGYKTRKSTIAFLQELASFAKHLFVALRFRNW